MVKKIILLFLLFLTSCYEPQITPSTSLILTRNSWRVDTFIDSNINRTSLFTNQRMYFYSNNTTMFNYVYGSWYVRFDNLREELLLLHTVYPYNLLSNDWEITFKSMDRIEMINRNYYPHDYLIITRF